MKIGDLVKVRVGASNSIGVVTKLFQEHGGTHAKDFRYWNAFAIELLPLGEGEFKYIFPNEIVEVVNENR